MKKKDAVFYVAQKAFIKKGDKILILTDPIEGLDFPGGKIQEGETDLVESLKREVKEETKLEISVERPFVIWAEIFPPHHKLAGKKVMLIGYHCQYVSGKIKLSAEHSNFTWVSKDNYSTVDDGSSYLSILEKYFAE